MSEVGPTGRLHKTAGTLDRVSGATHSFRLRPHASKLVNAITNPRRLGGKSAKVSDAIEWYFDTRNDNPSYVDLLKMVATMQKVIDDRNEEIERLQSESFVISEETGQFTRTGQIPQNEGQKDRQSEPQSRGIWIKFRNLWSHN